MLPDEPPWRLVVVPSCGPHRLRTQPRAPRWEATAGGLVTLDASGVLSGTPAVAGRYIFTVHAFASAALRSPCEWIYTLVIAPPTAAALASLHAASVPPRVAAWSRHLGCARIPPMAVSYSFKGGQQAPS